jgi:hypothetical protein
MSNNDQPNIFSQEMKDDPALVNLVYLDTISRRTGSLLKSQELIQTSLNDKLTKLLDAHVSSISIGIENQNILSKLLKSQATIDKQLSRLVETNIENQVILNQILRQTTLSARELQADADKGGWVRFRDSVGTTAFVIYNISAIIGHKAKNIVINNDGDNSIYVTLNGGEIDLDTIDVNASDSVFDLIKPHGHFNSDNNRDVIDMVHLLSAKDTSMFRITLTW